MAGVGFGALLLTELLWFGYGRSPQCAPSLYYPANPLLEKLAKAAHGRVLGIFCLPARLSEVYGLRDIRGYDAVDSARLMDLMRLAADPRSPRVVYALTQNYLPKIKLEPPGAIGLSPVLDMLGVRYLIAQKNFPSSIHPVLAGDGFAVLENRRALDRVFVPERVEVVESTEARLTKLAAEEFDARKVGYSESALSLPAQCKGAAQILEEVPSRLVVAAQMETAGLLILADLWDPGWHAYVGDHALEVLRVNHALLGVVLPAGDCLVEFRYESARLALGLKLAAAGGAAIALWILAVGRVNARGRLT